MSDARRDVLSIVQQMCRDHLVLGTWGNVSVREGNSCFITPSGMPYDLLTTDDLVRIDLTSLAVHGRWKPSSEWRMHHAMYQGRPDCNAIVHTHSIYATAFAVARVSIPPVVEDMVQVVGGSIDVATYALPGTIELAVSALQALGDKSAVLLASHGLVGIAGSLEEALKVCQIVEKTAQVVLLARSLGTVVELSQSDVVAMRTFYQTSYGPLKDGEEKSEDINSGCYGSNFKGR